MITFWEWLGLIREGDEGYRSFIDQTNAAFRAWIAAILRMGKFADPRNEAEARTIVADPHYFNYAQELLAAASGGRARLRGQDVLDGAQEANVELWRTLLNPRLYEPQGVTWETENPHSAGRNGIRGTIRSWARNTAGHFAARIHKRRASVATLQTSQVRDPGPAFDPPARSEMSEFEWDDLKRAVVHDLERQLRQEVEAEGPHWQARARNLRWASEIVQRQMAVPWTWRSLPEVAADMPELRGRLRGGLADQLKTLIDQARRKALGEGH